MIRNVNRLDEAGNKAQFRVVYSCNGHYVGTTYFATLADAEEAVRDYWSAGGGTTYDPAIWSFVAEANAEQPAPANPKQAYGDKKAPLHLVPPALTIAAAGALKEGAAKYGAFNWRDSKVEAMTYVGAMLRHLAAYADGEDVDPESTTGKLHLGGVAACLAILLDADAHGTLIDNRKKGPAPELVRTPKEAA